jgi:probable F420-dependent oxidoreductase
MRFGIHLRNHGKTATPDYATALAQAADELGFDSVWVSDHVVIPDRFTSRYPFRGNPFTPAAWGRVHEPLITLAFVAGATARVRVGLSVLILPQRNPVLTAKQIATLDSLTWGRLELGVGAGWLAEEFAALGADFNSRGHALDEWLEIFHGLWTKEVASHSGTHYSFEKVHFAPKPARPEGPPITVGGHSRAALRRAAAVDGWQAVRLSPEELHEPIRRLKRLAERRRKDPETVRVLLRCDVDLAHEVDTSEVWRVVGPPDHVSETVARYADAGATELVFTLSPQEPQAAVEAMQRLAGEVLPNFRPTSV